jgi:hypothetical protein
MWNGTDSRQFTQNPDPGLLDFWGEVTSLIFLLSVVICQLATQISGLSDRRPAAEGTAGLVLGPAWLGPGHTCITQHQLTVSSHQLSILPLASIHLEAVDWLGHSPFCV